MHYAWWRRRRGVNLAIVEGVRRGGGFNNVLTGKHLNGNQGKAWGVECCFYAPLPPPLQTAGLRPSTDGEEEGRKKLLNWGWDERDLSPSSFPYGKGESHYPRILLLLLESVSLI